MYDRLNELNNSNDIREIQHIQERQYKRKWSDKSSNERPRKKTGQSETKIQVNRCGQCGAPNWSRMHNCLAKSVECRICKSGLYEKMCRSWKKVQHFERISSSAKEDNWDYNTIQKLNGKDHKAFSDTTLLVNERPFKFIKDSGSPVTLIPNCLFNELIEVEPLITTYKDVNNQKIEIVGQTKTIVKTNKETLNLPLLITRITITPLTGLDWM